MRKRCGRVDKLLEDFSPPGGGEVIGSCNVHWKQADNPVTERTFCQVLVSILK